MTPTVTPSATALDQILAHFGIQNTGLALHNGHEGYGASTPEHHYIYSPVNGALIGQVELASSEDYLDLVGQSRQAFEAWRLVPAPRRGEIVRQMGNAFRENKEPLARLVTWEMGKIYQEALGEVQEIIDICDFAVGLSRQLYGLTMPSERPGHRLYEQWHPLGVVGVISAFNFPVAVWAWNAMLAAVCGNTVVWKPSEKTPFTALACMNIVSKVIRHNGLPQGVFSLVLGDAAIGKKMACDNKIALVSATGSTRMGKSVAESTGRRLGKNLLELGGNNAIIITANADLELALRATVFAAVGTAGQRCTTARRLIIHENVYDTVRDRLTTIYQSMAAKVGNPHEPSTLIGPLIDRAAAQTMQETLEAVQHEGGKVLVGGQVLTGEGFETGTYVLPALVEAQNHYASVQRETFAPILYLLKYSTLEEAIALQNGVPQGLSSSIFTLNMREAEQFLSAVGSDCGIANVNIGPSGAEIGGAFGGEKETGGGRESGSDAWKAYMRRQTVTINYSEALPLAQGIEFNF